MSDTDSESVTSPSEDAPLAAYFTALTIASPFTYQPTLTAHDNFARLCTLCGWTKKSSERARARHDFNDALVQQFNFIYGTDENDIQAWQNLCRVILIAPVPDTVEECRVRVWDAHVNIVDLVDTFNTGEQVRNFASLEELREYTKRTKKFFPKENAYQGGLLKELLREILHKYFGRRRNGSEKRKRRRARRRAAAAPGGTA